MFKIILRIVIGLLAGVGLWAVGSKLVSKYYEGLNDSDSDLDVDEFDDDDACCDCCDNCCSYEDEENEEKTEEEQ